MTKNKIDYTHKYECKVVDVFVKHEDSFLLLKRGENVLAYKNMWCVVSGFLDDKKTPKQKALQELKEEVGLKKDAVEKITNFREHVYVDDNINRKWIITPVLIEVNKKQIKLNDENKEYAWLSAEDFMQKETVPGLKNIFTKILNS